MKNYYSLLQYDKTRKSDSNNIEFKMKINFLKKLGLN